MTRIGQTNCTLRWTASFDNVEVTAYDIYVNSELHTSTDITTCIITGLTEATDYTVSIVARDIVNNTSEKSSELSVTTSSVCSSTIDWTNTSFSEAKTGTFTVEFDATPEGDNRMVLLA